MLNIYDAIGKKYEIVDDTLKIFKTTYKNKNIELSINESGTCLRFILPYFAFTGFEKVVITLGKRLSQRPKQPLIDCLNQAGAIIKKENDKIVIESNTQRLGTIEFYVNSSESSQFLSSIMMYKSSLSKEIKIVTDKEIASESYIKTTADVIELLSTHSHFAHCTRHFKLPPDYSTACYFWFYSIILNKKVFIQNNTSIHQPDYQFIDVLKSIGVNFIEEDEWIGVDHVIARNEAIQYKLIKTINMSNMPDQIITLSFLLLFLKIEGNITGCKTLFLKESNRVEGIIENIILLGSYAKYDEVNDILTIKHLNIEPKQCILKTYNDHRFAMTFLVLKEKYPYLEIDNIDCINKSYPDFRFMKPFSV